MSCDGECIILSSDDETVLIEQPEAKEPSDSHTQTKGLGNRKLNGTINEASTQKVTHIKAEAVLIEEEPTCAIYVSSSTDIEPGTSSTYNDRIEGITPSQKFKQLTDKMLSMEEKKEDRTRIIKKLNKYHDLANRKYLKSQEFNNSMNKWMEFLEKDPSSLYLVLKEVLDCLLVKRAIIGSSKTKIDLGECRIEQNYDNIEDGEEYVHFLGNDENHKILKRLNKTLKKLSNKIKEIEVEEVDLSDEENSGYVKLQRYRERFCQVYKKICSYTGQKTDGGRLHTSRIFFSGTKNLEVNQSIEKWLNKIKCFPDFVDVLNFINEINDSQLLGLSKAQKRNMAEEVFRKIGTMLQQRREYDMWDSFCFYLDMDQDPALKEPELEAALQKNSEIAMKKMNEVLKYYTEKQVSDKLEAVEVPEDEADRSPVESGDEDEKEIEKVEEMLVSQMSDIGDDDVEDSENENNKGRETSEKYKVHRESDTVGSEDERISASPVPDVTEKVVETKKTNECCNSLKRLVKSEEISVKKMKIETISCGEDDESDCDVVLIEDEEENCSVFPKRKLVNNDVKTNFHINYAFVNNNFNYNSFMFVDKMFSQREKVRSFKKERRQKKWNFPEPLSDLTYLKGRRKVPRPTWEKNEETAEQVVKKYIHSRFSRNRPCDRPRVKHMSPFVPNKMIVQSALKNKKENVNSGSGKEDIGKDYSDGRGSGESGGNSTNGGGLGGGNGQDNNEDDRDKKPTSQQEETSHNSEDEEEKDESTDGTKQLGEEQTEEVLQIVSTPDIDPELFSDKSPNGYGVHYVDVEEEREDGRTLDDGARYVHIGYDNIECRAITRPSFSNSERARRRGGRGTATRRRGSRTLNNVTPRTANSLTGGRGQRFPRPEASPSSLEAAATGARIPPQKGALRRVWSDEEIVRNFLQRSPPSITITTPRRKVPERNAPSPSVVQAMETLSRLKGISLTLVKGKRKETDSVIVGENSMNAGRPSDFPIPKIVTVQGNVSGFEDIPERGETLSKRRGSPLKGPHSRRRASESGTSLEGAPAPRFRNTHPRTNYQRGGPSLRTTAKDNSGSSSNCVIID